MDTPTFSAGGQSAVTIVPAAKSIVLDIETADAPAEAVQEEIEAADAEGWKAPANWKPETVAAKREEREAKAREKIKDKAALLDASPIICIGIRSPSAALMFSSMGKGHLDSIPGWDGVIECYSEAVMLEGLQGWLNVIVGPETQLVGHGCRGFDLPKLRHAYIRNRQPLPDCLRPALIGPSQPVTDTMILFKHFSMQHRDDPFVSLETACKSFGIPRPKQIITGAMVPEMYRAGRYAEILTYCAIDVDSTSELYNLMMS